LIKKASLSMRVFLHSQGHVTGHRPLSHPWDSKRQLGINQTNASKSMERLSSGMRINRAGDDAAGLAISEKMRGQIRGLKQAQRNAQDGISLIQTAEGALNETHAILQRMRELAVQAANDTNTEVDRSEIQKEINELIDEIDRIANQTQFNTKHLLNGTFTGTFHIGANETQRITLTIGNMAAGRAPEVTFDTPIIDEKLVGASVSSVAGFDQSGEVTFSVIHSAGEAAKHASATFTVGPVPSNGDTITIAGKVIAFSEDGNKIGDEDHTINLTDLDAKGVAAAIADLSDDIEGVTITANDADVTVTVDEAGIAGNSTVINAFGTTEFTGGADAVPSRLSATIDEETVLQTVASGAGEMTYTTESGKSVTADLGTFNLNEDESVDIVFNVTVEDVPDDEKGLQVGQLKVENVTKDSVGGIMTQEGADKAITVINDAIEAVSQSGLN
jgi:flagellin